MKQLQFKTILIFEAKLILLGFAINLVYEIIQSPLFIFPRAETTFLKSASIVHCTLGDVLILLISYHVVAIATKNIVWISQSFSLSKVVFFTLLGVGYTIFSEWHNVYIRMSWGYKSDMPLVPGLRVGLTPLIQWMVLPSLVAFLVNRWSTSLRE